MRFITNQLLYESKVKQSDKKVQALYFHHISLAGLRTLCTKYL